MAKRQKKGIYREVDGVSHLCKWYKRGKHRVLVDEVTQEVVAHNPLPLLASLGMAVAPTVIDKITSKKEKVQPTQRIITDSKDRPNYAERLVNQVMKDERLV